MPKAISLLKWKDVINSMAMLNKTDGSIERKIVDALEKISQVLRTLAWRKAVEQSITPIQLQILTFLLNHSENLARVSILSREFNISKASISETVKLLESKKLIEKVYDKPLSMQFAIRLSAEGLKKAFQSSLFDEVLMLGIGEMLLEEKEIFFSMLLHSLLSLHEKTIVSHQRMCQTCKHCSNDGIQHHCGLLGQHMSISQLQIDCNEHQINK